MIKGKLFFEIFDEFQKAQNKKERIEVLRKYDHPGFRLFLQYALNTKVKFDIETIPYRPAQEPPGLNFTYLQQEMPKLYRFVTGHPEKPAGITTEKQKQLLVVILESLYAEDARILGELINRSFKIPNLTTKLVQEAFPGI